MGFWLRKTDHRNWVKIALNQQHGQFQFKRAFEWANDIQLDWNLIY